MSVSKRLPIFCRACLKALLWLMIIRKYFNSYLYLRSLDSWKQSSLTIMSYKHNWSVSALTVLNWHSEWDSGAASISLLQCSNLKSYVISKKQKNAISCYLAIAAKTFQHFILRHKSFLNSYWEQPPKITGSIMRLSSGSITYLIFLSLTQTCDIKIKLMQA